MCGPSGRVGKSGIAALTSWAQSPGPPHPSSARTYGFSGNHGANTDRSMPFAPNTRIICLSALLIVWCAVIGFGLVKMLTFELTPAPATTIATQWPKKTNLSRDSSRPTLLLFLHPRCPCSRATLQELDRLAAECPDRFALCIIFVRPPNAPDGWHQTDLYRSANAISHAFISVDENGDEAGRFGAATSGQTLLYSADGRLLFRGGITPSRGHEGDNVGRTALASILNTGHSDCAQTAVFGCSLVNHSVQASPNHVAHR
jgi:hypothetical protein